MFMIVYPYIITLYGIKFEHCDKATYLSDNYVRQHLRK